MASSQLREIELKSGVFEPFLLVAILGKRAIFGF